MNSMSDYESYWADREKEGLEEEETVAEESIIDTYRTNGETVDVEIGGAWATFRYQNGTVNTVPLSDLYLCPRCMKEGRFPFCTVSSPCPEHEHDLIKFDLREYENFKIVAQMQGGMLVPQ